MNSLSLTAKISRGHVTSDRVHTLYLLVNLDALGQSGLPVYIDPATHRYRFTSQVFLQPLTFSVEEATALVQCVQGL